MHIALLLLALLGHLFLWIGVINRLDAMGVRRKAAKLTIAVCFVWMVALSVGWAAWLAVHPQAWQIPWHAATPAARAQLGYLVVCWLAALATLTRLAWLRLMRRPTVVRGRRRRWAVLKPSAAANTQQDGPAHCLLARMPGNEVLRLEINEWTVDVPRLDAALDGLTVLHLSDLHFTGWIGKSYFQEVVRVGNELRPDVVAITGDLVDHADYIDWIPDTLGRLTAPYGVYFVLGNHDVRRKSDVVRLRRTLVACGLIDLGHDSQRVEVRGRTVLLAGNELPWGRPATAWQDPNATDAAVTDAAAPALRIALAHSPDQLEWARRAGADLLLAGHTHGGQIRIPPFGAIFSPTFRGVRYAAGLFHCHPTILHVARGVSGDIPIRWNCPPEITLLRLRAGQGTARNNAPDRRT